MKKGHIVRTVIERSLFGSKWLLIPFYFGLIIAQVVYLYWFTEELLHMLQTATTIGKNEGMLLVLELVDIVMIANLIKMIISGSYTSFITKDHEESSEKSSSGILKVKMSTSLVGVSSIHLLQSFINAEQISWDTIQKQMWIHGIFLVGAIVLMVIEYLHVKTEH
jgi:uncharacterized protein (TIGR00645 family)